MKECPYCKREISDDASSCPYCNRRFQQENRAIFRGCLAGCLIFSALIILFSFLLAHTMYVSFRSFLDGGYGYGRRRYEFRFGYPYRYRKENPVKRFLEQLKKSFIRFFRGIREFFIPRKYRVVLLRC